MFRSIINHPFLLALSALFLLHQLLQKAFLVSIPFVDNYLDDFLCIPIVLFLFECQMTWLLKGTSYKLPILDAILITLLIALFFEEILPRWNPEFTRDWWDYLAYGCGFLLWEFLRKGKVQWV